MRLPTKPRRALISVWVLVVLSVLTALTATATWQYLAGRRMLRDRQQAQQATWLARSGIELAAAHLLADPNYRGEKLTPLEDSQVQVEVTVGKDGQLEVTATARYPASKQPHVRTATRVFRRMADNEKTRLEVVP